VILHLVSTRVSSSFQLGVPVGQKAVNRKDRISEVSTVVERLSHGRTTLRKELEWISLKR
jgi:hypothetical protein